MKRRYTCDDLGGSPIGECRDFYPSLTTAQMSGGRGENEEKYLAFQEKCAESAEAETAYYAEQGCKRRAHRMLPGGRSATRYGSPDSLQTARSGLSYPQRLERLETSLRHRTQPVRPAPARAEVVPIGATRVREVEELLTKASLGENQDQLSPRAYQEKALPALRRMVRRGLIDPARLDKFSNRADKGERVSLTFAGKVGEPASGLATRIGEKIFAFNARLSNTLTSGSRKKEPFSVAPDLVGGAQLILKTDRGVKADFPVEARIIAVNGNRAPFAELQRRAANFRVPPGREAAAPYAIALLLFFFKAVSDNADAKGRVRLTIVGYDNQPYTLPPVSLKGLQHSDVVQASDPKRKSYYTFRNLSKREVAEYLLGLRPRTVQRKKRRGRPPRERQPSGQAFLPRHRPVHGPGARSDAACCGESSVLRLPQDREKACPSRAGVRRDDLLPRPQLAEAQPSQSSGSSDRRRRGDRSPQPDGGPHGPLSPKPRPQERACFLRPPRRADEGVRGLRPTRREDPARRSRLRRPHGTWRRSLRPQ